MFPRNCSSHALRKKVPVHLPHLHHQQNPFHHHQHSNPHLPITRRRQSYQLVRCPPPLPPPAAEGDTAHPWRHMVDTRSVISLYHCNDMAVQNEKFGTIHSWKRGNYVTIQISVFKTSPCPEMIVVKLKWAAVGLLSTFITPTGINTPPHSLENAKECQV